MFQRVFMFFSVLLVLGSVPLGQTNSPGRNPSTGSAVATVPSQAQKKQESQMEQLIEAFKGQWVISEELAPDAPSPKKKSGMGDIVWRVGPGGFSLVEEYRSKQGDQEINGLGVFWWDDTAQGYHTIWCDSTNPGGCIDFKNAAKWDGPNLVLREDYEANDKKFTFKEVFSDISITHFTQTLYGAEAGHELKVDQVIHAFRNMPVDLRR